MGVMKEIAQGYQTFVTPKKETPALGNSQKPQMDFNGVKMPNDNPHPMVIIIKDMTTYQACEAGKLLSKLGIHGCIQGGVLATQLANQWIPDEAELARREEANSKHRRRR